MVEAIDRRVGEWQGDERAEWSERERKGRVEGDEEVVVSMAEVNQAGEEADMTVRVIAVLSYRPYGRATANSKSSQVTVVKPGGENSPL